MKAKNTYGCSLLSIQASPIRPLIFRFSDATPPIARIEKESPPLLMGFGIAKGEIELTDAFFEPLPEEIIQSFYS